MPKLLQINVVSNLLSTGKITNDISKVASCNGWETYVACGRGSRPGISHVIKIGNKSDPYFHYLVDKIFDGEGTSSKSATQKFIRLIDEIKPDLIHLHNLHDHYINYPILFKYISEHNIPTVWTQHDCWAFTGGCMYFDMNGCEEWKRGCNICQFRRKLLFNNSRRNFQLKKEYIAKIPSLAFVAVSDWLAEIIKQSEQGGRIIQVIHNGINVSLFKSVPKKDTSKKFKILGVASPWSKRKGLQDFITIRSMLSDEYQITLVGLSKKQIKELPPGIIGIERTFNINELIQLYSDSDVYVNPTYSDNFPTTNIEALACGTPVITYRTGGSPEAIDEKTGIVVEQGKIDELVKAIIDVKVNPIKSEDCRLRAVEHFDMNKNFMNYIKLYQHLLVSK